MARITVLATAAEPKSRYTPGVKLSSYDCTISHCVSRTLVAQIVFNAQQKLKQIPPRSTVLNAVRRGSISMVSEVVSREHGSRALWIVHSLDPVVVPDADLALGVVVTISDNGKVRSQISAMFSLHSVARILQRKTRVVDEKLLIADLTQASKKIVEWRMQQTNFEAVAARAGEDILIDALEGKLVLTINERGVIIVKTYLPQEYLQ
jgi:hypothetical protein